MVFCISLIENILRIILACFFIESINFFRLINIWNSLGKFYLELIKRNCKVLKNKLISLGWRSTGIMSSQCSCGLDPFRWESGDLTLSLLGFSMNLSNPMISKRSSTQIANSKILSQRNGDASDRLNNLCPLKEKSPVVKFKLPRSYLKATLRHELHYPNWVCQLSITELLKKALAKNTLLQWVPTILEVFLKLLIHKK